VAAEGEATVGSHESRSGRISSFRKLIVTAAFVGVLVAGLTVVSAGAEKKNSPPPTVAIPGIGGIGGIADISSILPTLGGIIDPTTSTLPTIGTILPPTIGTTLPPTIGTTLPPTIGTLLPTLGGIIDPTTSTLPTTSTTLPTTSTTLPTDTTTLPVTTGTVVPVTTGTTGAGAVPLDKIAPLLAFTAKTLTASSTSNVTLPLGCPADEQECSGNAVLETAKAVNTSAKKKLKLGSKSFKVAGGKTLKLKIKLNRKARALLKKSGKIKARAILTVKDAAGNSKVTKKRVTIKAAR